MLKLVIIWWVPHKISKDVRFVEQLRLQKAR